ncbi:capsular polysaccharide synthesis protein [Streptococcus orisratti]
MNKFNKWLSVYGLKNILLRVFYEKFPIIPVPTNPQIRRNIWQNKYKKKLVKYLRISDSLQSTERESEYIWVLWFQGFENAPEIVQNCYQSVQEYAKKSGKILVSLDENNLFEFVTLPEFILDKWKSGIIGDAHFSDLCRLSLLSQYGGIWIDSTVLLTDDIDNDILESNFFVFQSSPLDISSTKISNWFIYAKYPKNRIIESMNLTLLNFWKKNNKIGDYFIFHLFFSLLIETDELKGEFDKCLFQSNIYPHLLYQKINNNYNESEFLSILNLTSIHKLSYKNLDKKISGTYYQYILERFSKKI